MNTLLTFLALLAFAVTDPPGDAVGDGALVPPTSPLYANVAMFDLQTVEVEVAEDGTAVLRVTLGSLGPAAATDASQGDADDAEADGATDEAARALAATQFDVSGLLAVVDVYLSTGADGASQTLRGPNMLMPAGSGWRHAVRISAEGAWGITFIGDNGAVPVEPPGADVVSGTLQHTPLNLGRRGNELSLVLPWQYEPNARVDVLAVSGVHDPFSPDAWRPLSETPSPWAFSGGEQVAPVIDVLAADAAAQTRALRTGVLPAPSRGSASLPLSPWLWLMVAGVAVAVLGLVLRARVQGQKAAASDEGAEVAAGDAAHGEDDDVDVLATLLPFESDLDEAPPAGSPGAEDLPVLGDGSDVEAGVLPAGSPAGEDLLVPGDGSDVEAEAPHELAVTATPAAGGSDLVVDDTGERLVEIGDPADGPADATNGATGMTSTVRSPFSTSVEESYLATPGGEGYDGFTGSFGDGEDESFWHPATRETTTKLKKTLIDRVIAAGEDGAPDPKA